MFATFVDLNSVDRVFPACYEWDLISYSDLLKWFNNLRFNPSMTHKLGVGLQKYYWKGFIRNFKSGTQP